MPDSSLHSELPPHLRNVIERYAQGLPYTGHNEALGELYGLLEQLEAKQRELDEAVERAVENGRLAKRELEIARAHEVEIAGLREQYEAMDDALREILDVTEKWTRRMTDEERLLRIDTIAKAALPKVSSPAKSRDSYTGADWQGEGPEPPWASNQDTKDSA